MCVSMCLCGEERERRLKEAKILPLLIQSYKLNWFPSLSLALSLSVCPACMSSNTQYVLSLSLPCSRSLPLCLIMFPPFLFSLLYIYSGLQTVCTQSQFFPRALGRDGGNRGGWREREGEQSRHGGDSEPCGTCAVHLFQMAETQICAF